MLLTKKLFNLLVHIVTQTLLQKCFFFPNLFNFILFSASIEKKYFKVVWVKINAFNKNKLQKSIQLNFISASKDEVCSSANITSASFLTVTISLQIFN